MNLNERQLEAVKYISGPCLVIAGAGSGKTRVITSKIEYLLDTCGYPGYSVAAVTFTNKAAREMKERVFRSVSPEAAEGLIVTTFHSLGLRIIRTESSRIGLRSNFMLFDERDKEILVRSILSEIMPSADSDDFSKDDVERLLSFISSCKMDMVEPEDSQARAEDASGILASRVYSRYAAMMQSYGALDLDDLIYLPVIFFRSHPDVLARWQRRLRYILVDEYQDTNSCQYELLKLLAGERQAFTVVGDDDQSIYSWRGARPENIDLLIRDFPQTKVIKLEQNYRSTGRILKCANALISSNSHTFGKKLFSSADFGPKVNVFVTKDDERQAELLSGEILGSTYMHHARWKDYAVLYRSSHLSRVIEKAFVRNRIPYRISGSVSFFDRSEVKDFLSYFRLILNHDDDNAFLRVVNTPRRDIGAATTEKLGIFARKHGMSMFDAAQSALFQKEVGAGTFRSLGEFCEFISDRTSQAEDDARGMAESLADDLGYGAYLSASSKSEDIAGIRMRNVEQLVSWLTEKLDGNPREHLEPQSFEASVHSLCTRDMLEHSSLGEDDEELDQVQLMTLHASKGLEFPYVYIIGMEEGVLPHQSAIDEGDVTEERRLCYVGITRAMRELNLMEVKTRRGAGRSMRRQGENDGDGKNRRGSPDDSKMTESRFIGELPSEDLDIHNETRPKTEDEKAAEAKNVSMLLKEFLQSGG